MSILFCRDCGVDVSGEALFRGVSFSLEEGEKAGLVGPNGAGKTTLLKACLGEHPVESGQVHRTGSYGYLAQAPLIDEGGTVLQSMLEECSELIALRGQIHKLEEKMASCPEERVMEQYAILTEKFEREGGYEFEAQIRKILSGLGLGTEMNLPVSHLSGGQRTRLALSKLLLRSPDLLILDEPTNHLDIEALEWLESFLRDYKGSVLVVSHDRYFLDKTVSKILRLAHGELKVYQGNFSEYELQYSLEEKALEREAEKHAKKIAKLEEYIQRNKAGVNAKQARGRETQLKKLQPVQGPKTEKHLGISLQSSGRSGDRVLMLEDFSVSFGSNALFNNVNLELRRGDRVALLGKNGAGKTSFLKAVLGQIDHGGTCRLGANVKVAYYSQEHEDLDPSCSVIDEIRNISQWLDPEIRSLLAQYGFRGEEVFKSVKVLSGGEKSRLALCKLFLAQGNLLLLDEPTNHLDTLTRELLEEALQDYDGTVLVVSHDRYFLDRVINKVVHIEEQKITVYDGDYTEYREAEQRNSLSEDHIKSSGNSTEAVRRESKNTQRKQKKIEELEKEIANLENQLKSLEAELEASAADYEKAMKIHTACEETRSLLERSLDTWMELSE